MGPEMASDLETQVATLLAEEDPLCLEWDDSAEATYAGIARRFVSDGADVGTLEASLRALGEASADQDSRRREPRLQRVARRVRAALSSTPPQGPLDLRAVHEEAMSLFLMQNKLIAALESDSPLDSSGRRGLVEVDGVTWSFDRHGGGVTFECFADGCMINAHDGLELRPVPIDAWRTAEFLASKGIVEVASSGGCVAAEQVPLQRMFERLVHDAGWTRLDEVHFYPLSHAVEVDALSVRAGRDPRTT